MSDKLRFTLSPQFLFFYTIIVLLVPNVTLSITEGMPLAAAVANVLLPACLYTLLMSLSGKTGRQVWILFPLVFFAAFQMVLIYLYGSGVIGVGMFLNLVTTNPDEALELLDNLVPALVIVFVLYLPLLFIAGMQWARHTRLEATRRRSWRRAALLGLAASAVYTAALYVAYPKGEEKKGRFEYRVEDDMYPFNVFYNLGLAVRESYNSAHYQERVAHFKFCAVATHPADSAEVYVLVVGETARSRNFQLYGYKRPTNPLLSREQGLIVYTGVRTQSNTTHRSVPMLLTAATADDHDRLYHEKGILAAFGEAGFHTAFFSNQLPNHSYIDFLGEEAHDVRFIKKGKSAKLFYDVELLPYVKSELARGYRKLFIVLHMYGSHFNYRDRYARSRALFLPDTPTEAEPANRPQLLNAYDNTIVETDYILARLIDMLRGEHCAAALLYTSDHGENIFDDKRKLFLHASPKPSEYDTDVPLLIWTSPAYDRQNPAVVGNLRRNRHKGVESNASVFPTMLSMAGIQAKARVDSLSLTNPAYRLGVRYYLNDHNHGVPLSAWGIK